MPDFYYFFLSYARHDDRTLVERFFEELSVEVRLLAGQAPESAVGYLDVHVPVGTRWPRTLTRALAGSANFLALISPRYLRSEACGREWTVFSERMRQLEEAGGAAPSAMMPIIWIPTDRLPQEISDRQYTDRYLPHDYANIGLRQMLRLQRWEQVYIELLPKLARQIVAAAHARSVPEGPDDLDFHTVRSAFANLNEERQGPAQGTHDVNFIIVAPSRDQAAGVDYRSRGARITRDLQFYGRSELDWAPFRPSTGATIADQACRIAYEKQFRPVATGVDGAMEILRAREEADHPCAVLIVDPWTTQVAECRQALAQLRQAGDERPIAAVLVPAGYEDRNTRDHIGELASALQSILMNGSWRQLTYRSDVLSPDAFNADLQVVLEGCRSRALNVASRTRRPRGPSNRPILTGP